MNATATVPAPLVTVPRSPPRVHMAAFGCQMNVLDAEVVVGELLRRGYERAASEDEADIVLFHTCSVRQHAEDRVWSRLGALKRRKRLEPALRIGVLGCMAQRDGRSILVRAPHVDVVCGTRMFPRIGELLDRTRDGERVLAVDEVECLPPPRNLSARPDRHKAFVTVMRGCDHRCTFCIVPTVRGPEVSVPEDEIVAEVEALAGDGAVEVTLLGQNIDSYGRDLPGRPTLARLLRRCAAAAGLRRLRFITSHPGDITEELLDTMGATPQVCPYLHMPAQSGSDPVLRRMARKYTAARYREIVAEARRRVPGIELASDWIVGFPGETDADFEESLRLLSEVECQTSYVFKYSPRPGTPATRLPDDVPEEAKRERNHRLLAAQTAISERRNRARAAETVEVLVDGPSERDPARLSGRTRENQVVVFPGPAAWRGTFRQVRVTGATAAALYAEPAADAAG